ncbi:hypothetical protein TCA2_4584 [Paenibacillus sp. TCA20]|uniref:Uncharacterized protein n=1 Tax=Paenibacillus urinalis TaxID=521520 RepID=A0ABY7XJX0_9BACL|nr:MULTISPECIES: hypothetical protein [Paenibacillus]WDI05081.1 hypothetical protein PUW25_26285 [Paenibacillus urinalis]GAK42092.1 hypothetical protein TCA2_4584 [Paenibacillus sp. TCA20]
MLIGKHFTTEELMTIMKDKITDLDMETRKLQKEYNDLNKDMASNPPQKNKDDERPMKLKQLREIIEDKMNEGVWLEQKVDEAEKAIEKDPNVASQKTMLSLNDMLRLGVEDPEEPVVENEE